MICEGALRTISESLSSSIDADCLLFSAVYSMVVKKELYKCSFETEAAWQAQLEIQGATRQLIDSSARTKADFVNKSRRCFKTYGFWPWQAVETDQQPERWSRYLLEGFLKLPQGVQLDGLRRLLADAITSRADRISGPKLGMPRKRALSMSDLTFILRSDEIQALQRETQSADSSSKSDIPCSPSTLN